MEKRYLNATETAKLIRARLKKEFPATKFRVYQTGGGSIQVKWTDGPTKKLIGSILEDYDSKGFDGMIDLQYYIETWVLNGEILGTRCSGTVGSGGTVSPWGLEKPHPDAELVSFGGGYHNADRAISPALAAKCVAQIAEYWGGVPAERLPRVVAKPADSWNPGEYELEPRELRDMAPREDLGGNGSGHYYTWSGMIQRAADDRTAFLREPIAPVAEVAALAAQISAELTAAEAAIAEAASQCDGLLTRAAVKARMMVIH